MVNLLWTTVCLGCTLAGAANKTEWSCYAALLFLDHLLASRKVMEKRKNMRPIGSTYITFLDKRDPRKGKGMCRSTHTCWHTGDVNMKCAFQVVKLNGWEIRCPNKIITDLLPVAPASQDSPLWLLMGESPPWWPQDWGKLFSERFVNHLSCWAFSSRQGLLSFCETF